MFKQYINTLLERKSDVQFDEFAREIIRNLNGVMENQIGNLVDKLESLVQDPRPLGAFDAVYSEDFKHEVETINPEHPLVEVWNRCKQLVMSEKFQNDRLYQNYRRFIVAAPETLYGVMFEFLFRDTGESIGKYVIKAGNGKLIRNRNRHQILISDKLHKFRLAYDDLFMSYQYLVYLKLYYPDQLAEEREGYYDDVIADDRSILTSMTEYEKFRQIVTHELRHAYDMQRHGTQAFNALIGHKDDDKLAVAADEKEKANYRIPNKTKLEDLKQRFKELFNDDVSLNKIGYFLSSHETNAYSSEFLGKLRAFLNDNWDYLKSLETNKILREFFSKYRIDLSLLATSDIFRATGAYEKFIGRLFTFINDYRKNKNE
jgi:hypothetical protein